MDSITINRKYEGLPDLDSAPDIYETPELTDDRGTTIQAYSDDDLGDDDEDDRTGISRSRLRIDEARSRFLPAHIDATAVDFSDRVDGKRRSYKSSSRRERILSDGTRELGDLSDDDGESLERRLARLQREAEEVKAEFAKRKAEAAEGESGGDGQQDGSAQTLAALSSTLEGMHITDTLVRGLGGATPSPRPPAPDTTTAVPPDASGGSAYTVTYSPAYEQSHALAKAADFDHRLLQLERALGIGSSALDEFDGQKLPRAVIPTLDDLQKQFAVLASANTTGLDTTARRVRNLAHEIQQLNDARRSEARSSEQNANKNAPGMQSSQDSDDGMSAQADKINALYGTLPVIDSLVPLLPPLLDRLRSLRSLHSEAARAADALAEVEAKQEEMESDLKMWREGLDKVEAKIGESETTMQGNLKVVEGWVKDIETRMEKLQ